MMRVRHCITLAPTQSPKLPPNQTALTSLPVMTTDCARGGDNLNSQTPNSGLKNSAK